MYAKHWDINAYHTRVADLCQFAAIKTKSATGSLLPQTGVYDAET
ncbi:hypothetical protein DZ08F97_50250 [Escherichia coli]|uniref:Uncharacterized protein n=1 Tax=Escherichia coli TaxID=562 RepID=A0A2Y0P8L7_ECOLX|nr:hypothetical protein FGAF1022_21910 [Escherichia coli]CAK0669950.1 hypothetical protein FGAF374_09400 [Escherichia coli]CAK1214141.1 hypothetical protein FGAF848_39790 [Escherichia coli]SPW73812.1 Uncharacterised protein [Escherichia coli]SRA12522.1 Uncharacterised protein [Escherichia coli]